MEKRLYRSRKDKVLAGVCGGIADYFEVDPTIIRLAWVVLVLLGGTGIVAYIIAAIIVPEEPVGVSQKPAEPPSGLEEAAQVVDENGWPEPEGPDIEEKNKKSRNAIGLLLIAMGVLFFARKLFYWFDFGYIWPILLIGAGFYFMVNRD